MWIQVDYLYSIIWVSYLIKYLLIDTNLFNLYFKRNLHAICFIFHFSVSRVTGIKDVSYIQHPKSNRNHKMLEKNNNATDASIGMHTPNAYNTYQYHSLIFTDKIITN